MASMTLKDVCKDYDSTRVLHGVSVDVAEGEFLVLVGPSGCGKSTLLRMIAGIEDISDGSIAIGGRQVNDLPPKQRDIAMVFQNYALYPHMNVAENMAFSLTLAKASKEEKDRRVREAAEILGLTELLERRPKQLSGGQRQRVAMGRAIVRKPKVFLFDEPLSNLDAKLRVAMRAEIRTLHQRLKTTSIYVTHDQVEAMTMADRIVVLNEGNVEQIGTPLELYDNPINVFVASFIGSPAMNFLAGKVVSKPQSDSPGLAVEITPACVLPLPNSTKVTVGKQVIYGIRPEMFRFNEEGLKAQVVVVEHMGSEMLVVMKLGGELVTAAVKERLKLHAGDMVSVSPDIDRVLLFDPSSGHRIPV